MECGKQISKALLTDLRNRGCDRCIKPSGLFVRCRVHGCGTDWELELNDDRTTYEQDPDTLEMISGVTGRLQAKESDKYRGCALEVAENYYRSRSD